MDPNDDFEDDFDDDDDDVDYDEEWHREPHDDEDGIAFADPGGRSALRAATKDNPRNLPCPSCEMPDRLTPADVAAGYQCNDCADSDEGLMY